MVYSTSYDKNADRQIPDRADRSPPDFLVPGRDLRYRSGIQQYRGMVALDSGRRAAAQGPAVLSPAGGEFGIRIRRLCLGAEPVARRYRRADPALAGRRDLRQGQVRRLPPAQSLAELAFAPGRVIKQKRRPKQAPFQPRERNYFAAGLAAAPAGCWASSLARASAARFCNSSCSFFWVSSKTFGSVGGPS